MAMTRLVSVCVAAAVMLTIGADAHADGTPLPNGAELKFNRFLMKDAHPG
jgi:hypothetical protein